MHASFYKRMKTSDTNARGNKPRAIHVHENLLNTLLHKRLQTSNTLSEKLEEKLRCWFSVH